MKIVEASYQAVTVCEQSEAVEMNSWGAEGRACWDV